MPKILAVTDEQIIEAYHRNGDNATKAAAELGISVPSVTRRVNATPMPLTNPKQEEVKSVEQHMVLGMKPDTDKLIKSLETYIPKDNDPEIVGYKPRQDYLDALTNYMDRNYSVLMIGEAGTGKTSLARYYSYEKKKPFLEVSCDSLLGFRELLGQVNITDGTSHFIEGLFTKFIRVPSTILLDEITALDPGKNFMLHQLLNTREFFIKEANRGEGETYRLHPECKIILACNPPNAKYPGTNRLNVALVDRPQVLWIDELTIAEVKNIVPESKEKASLIKFYQEAKNLIHRNGLRTTFSVRSLKKITASINAGMPLNDALHHGFLNAVRATAGDEGYKAVLGVAMTIWSNVRAR